MKPSEVTAAELREVAWGGRVDWQGGYEAREGQAFLYVESKQLDGVENYTRIRLEDAVGILELIRENERLKAGILELKGQAK